VAYCHLLHLVTSNVCITRSPRRKLLSRTVITFKASDSVWPEVESWAERNKFKEMPSVDGGRSFRRPSWSGSPETIRIEQSQDEVVIEAWLHTGLFLRIWFALIIPKEQAINSGIWFRMGQKNFREKLNPLLEQLGARTL
jgi:hypothetical protein